MGKKRWILLGLTLFLFSVFLSCEKFGQKELGEKELIRINDVSISLEDFRQMSEKQPLESKMRLLSEKELRDFLDNYVITQEVLYQEAKKKGLDKKKDILEKVEDFKRAMVIDALLEENLQVKGEVTEEDARKLVEKLEPMSKGRIEESETILWQSWWWFVPIVGLLTAEWILRKRRGLI